MPVAGLGRATRRQMHIRPREAPMLETWGRAEMHLVLREMLKRLGQVLRATFSMNPTL